MVRKTPTCRGAPKALPMPRLCLAPGRNETSRTFVGPACDGCIPGGCALAAGREPGRDPEGRRS